MTSGPRVVFQNCGGLSRAEIRTLARREADAFVGRRERSLRLTLRRERAAARASREWEAFAAKVYRTITRNHISIAECARRLRKPYHKVQGAYSGWKWQLFELSQNQEMGSGDRSAE